MATANSNAEQAFAPVLSAVNSMRDGTREQKKEAYEFLEKFQKSVRFPALFTPHCPAMALANNYA